MTYERIHEGVIGLGVLALVILGFVIISRWLDDREEARTGPGSHKAPARLRLPRLRRTHSRHRKPAPVADPVYGDTTVHDKAWDDVVMCGDDCREPEHQPRIKLPEPDGMRTWQPLRPTATVSLLPWETSPQPAIAGGYDVASMTMDELEAGILSIARRVALDLPGGVAPAPAAGEPDDVDRLIAAIHENLPGPESLATARAGEPVLQGVVVTRPDLGYIDATLALTDAYHERITRIGTDVRRETFTVRALAAAGAAS